MAQLIRRFHPRDRSRIEHVGCGGTVRLIRGKSACERCGLVDDNAGWINKVLMMNWHLLSLDGWPGWDCVVHGEGKAPSFVKLRLCVGKTPSSTAIDREWDDLAEGLFYSRDWTSTGSPFVRHGEEYSAGFWFEKADDRDRFMMRYATLVEM